MNLLANSSVVSRLRLGFSPALKRVAGEGLWVAAGQLLSAAGLLVGGRILTAYVPPEVFGVISLLLGVVAFGNTTCCSPHLQATLRFYPDLAAEGRLAQLRAVVSRSLRRTAGSLAGVILLAGLVASRMMDLSYTAFVALAVLLLAEVFRTFETNLLSAARRQRGYAIWQAAESCLRPGLAVLAVLLFGATPQAVLCGYALATVALLVLFHWAGVREGCAAGSDAGWEPQLGGAIHRFALPLIPLAVVSWISAVSDRYLVGGMVGLEAAGLYAAAYGLIGRPFLLLTSVIELILRPVYYEAVAAGDRRRETDTLKLWLWTTTGVSALGVGLIVLLKDVICSLLLAEPYRECAALMPWIAAGFACLVTAYVFEKTCYAHMRTVWVTIPQMAGAAACIVTEIPLIYYWGLWGAALAVPIYFGIQLVVSIVAYWIVSRSQSLSRKPFSPCSQGEKGWGEGVRLLPDTNPLPPNPSLPSAGERGAYRADSQNGGT